MKIGDDVMVYFDEGVGTPGTLRSLSEDGTLATVFFGHGWQTVLADTVKPSKVPPLKSRTMTLDQLQRRTIKVLRLMVKQLGRAAHEDGLSDNEFITQVIDPFDADIKTDRAVLKMAKQRKPV